MNILVIGGGGREHAIIKKIRENPKVENIYAAPGNGGIALDAECVNIPATDIEGILEFYNSLDIEPTEIREYAEKHMSWDGIYSDVIKKLDDLEVRK